MSTYSQAYQRALLLARHQALTERGVPRQALQRLYEEYAGFIEDIERDLKREIITSDRAEKLARIIAKKMEDLSAALATVLDKEKDRMIRLGIIGHENGVNQAAKAVGVSVSVNFDAIPERVLELMMRRRGFSTSANFKSVINRGLKSAASDIDRFLSSAVARGVSSTRAHRELAGILVQNDPILVELLKDGKLYKSEVNRAVREGVIDLADYKNARSALYDSRRIMVTENNTAFREADLQAAWESPVVEFKRWVVSGRHYGLPSTPDVCTMWHEMDLFGYGEGIFPIQNLPAPPHPFCGCRAEDVLRPPDKWGDPKPPALSPPSLSENSVARMFSDKTENHTKRQVEISNDMTRAAYRHADKKTKAA